MEKIKLVIWDLDDTFWKGTLSEGPVDIIPENIQIVKELVDRGIMNSIVSKNDFDKARKQLEDFGVWDLFIFPKISWNPKGEIVKQLLEQCKLRADNTLFVDDNPSNLQEVKYYNPTINVLEASQFSMLQLADEAFKGKNDTSHSRLEQYKILEQRATEETKYSSNIDFLKDSHITVSIEKDCSNHTDRIVELIQRTNQLNFTKIRLSKDEFVALIADDNVECRYIKVHDKFGDYGIVGFYALSKEGLTHFLFSCRILGLGVENYIFNKLGCPAIRIVGEVASELKPMEVSWVSEGIINQQTMTSKKPSILMIGGCDLQQTDFYLSGSFHVDREFATVVNGVEIRTSDTMQLVNALKLAKSEKDDLCRNLSCYNRDITFSTRIFDKDGHDVIIFSVVDDYIRGAFKHKTKDYHITLFGYFEWVNGQTDMLDKSSLSYLNEHFDYEGPESESLFEENLRFILDKVFAANRNTMVLLINGNEIDVSDWIGEERCHRNVTMNQVVDRVVKDYDRVQLVDMRTVVKDRADFSKRDNRHYTREVYYRMSLEIIRILKETTGFSKMRTNDNFWVSFKNFQKKVHDKISKIRSSQKS